MLLHPLNQKLHIPVHKFLIFFFRLHGCNLLRPVIMAQCLFLAEGFVLGPVIGSPLIIIIQKRLRQHVRNIFKNNILIQHIIDIGKGISVIQVQGHGLIRKFNIRIPAKRKQIQAVKNHFYFPAFKGLLHIIVQLCGHPGAFNCFHRSNSKGIVKPPVIEILRSGGTHNQAVVGEITDSSYTLIFFFGQYCFQRPHRFMIMKKGVKQHYQTCRQNKQDYRHCRKIFKKFPIHSFSAVRRISDQSRLSSLEIKINKGTHP